MSKNRRNRGIPSANTLADLNEETDTASDLSSMTTTDFANAGYGSRTESFFEPVGKGKITAKPIEIHKISPNSMQPRRTIPSGLRHYWNGNVDAVSMALLFQMWIKEIGIQRGDSSFDIDSYLLNESTTTRTNVRDDEPLKEDLPPIDQILQTHPYESALLHIVDLAASIYRDGLTNPITVAEQEGHFVIETGERRWMAFQLLHWRFPKEGEWSKIPARQVDQVNIWRQASENNIRADLNAIARARQLALLLMDIYRETFDFEPLETFEREQEFYAQVANGGEFSVPHGMGEKVLTAMGLKNTVQIRQYRRLLRLPPEVWTLADDLDWPQNTIERRILNVSQNDDEMIRLYAQKLAQAQGYSVSILTDSSVSATKTISKREEQYTRWRKKLTSLHRDLANLPRQHRDELLKMIRSILQEYEKSE